MTTQHADSEMRRGGQSELITWHMRRVNPMAPRKEHAHEIRTRHPHRLRLLVGLVALPRLYPSSPVFPGPERYDGAEGWVRRGYFRLLLHDISTIIHVQFVQTATHQRYSNTQPMSTLAWNSGLSMIK